jgi:hypothetical protein
MPTPDTRNSIVITKQFTYRAGTRTFSNRYHFEGDLPVDAAAWTTLADNITAAEKGIYASNVTIILATGYNAATATSTNPHGDAVFTKAYSLVGTLTPTTGELEAPGDAVQLLRFSTPARSAKNHPVYLFNYFHGAWLASTGGDDAWSGQTSAINTYGGDWVTGFTDGTGARPRCGPRGAVATGHSIVPFIRHRDFPV